MINEIISQESGLDEMVKALYSKDVDGQLQSTSAFRRMSSNATKINTIIQTGIVPRLVQLLQTDENPKLQFETTWILTNIASGRSSQTSIVVNAGAVPLLIKLLSSKSEDVQEQAVWALSNIAGDNPFNRNLLLNQGIMTLLLPLLWKSKKVSTIGNIAWLLSNLCRGKKTPDEFQKILPCLPALSGLLLHTDCDVLSKTCWALCYLCEGSSDHVQDIINACVCKHIVKLLKHDSKKVVHPALRVLRNIISGSNIHTQTILDCSVIPNLLHVLKIPRETIRQDVCSIISNIVAGSEHQIQAVIDAGIFSALIDILKKDDLMMEVEAAWVIYNVKTNGTAKQIKYLVEQGCIPPLFNLLNEMDYDTIQMVLDIIECILQFGQEEAKNNGGVNPYCSVIEQCGGVSKIKFLQTHKNTEIFWKVMRIVKLFFEPSDDSTDASSGGGCSNEDCVMMPSKIDVSV